MNLTESVENVGSRFRTVRKTLRVTAARLAEVSGLDVKTIENVERLRHRPRTFTLQVMWDSLRKEAERKRQAGEDTRSWPRCRGCHALLIADPGDDLLCADCRDPRGAEIRRAIARTEREASR